MTDYLINIDLKSETIFGSGEGVAGLVDVEVLHDAYGCPYLSGRALRGLLVEECANLLFALSQNPGAADIKAAAQRLFGAPGSSSAEQSFLHIGDATLPEPLRLALASEIDQKNPKFTRQDVLESLTTIRAQTAVDQTTGAPLDTSLRSMRVILRDTGFVSRVNFRATPEKMDLALLAACVSALRRAGLGRNRGKGELLASLLDESGKDVTGDYLEQFIKHLGGLQ